MSTSDEIQEWIVGAVARAQNVEPAAVDRAAPIGDLGLSSRELVSLMGQLEDRFEVELSPAAVWEHPTIARLATYVSSCA